MLIGQCERLLEENSRLDAYLPLLSEAQTPIGESRPVRLRKYIVATQEIEARLDRLYTNTLAELNRVTAERLVLDLDRKQHAATPAA